VFVVPQFQEIFKGFGADLPYLTTLVIALSSLIQSYWWVILSGLLISGYGILFCYRQKPGFRHFIERCSLKLPIFGKLLTKAAIARFSRTLATVFSAGVPIVEGLESVAYATGNIVFEKAALQIRNALSHGKQLNRAIQQTQKFPEMVVQMVAIGEESGELEHMLNKVADYYEEDVDNTVDTISTLIEPLLMVILGGLIGGLIIAMYLPIFKMGSIV
jgi:type IV pilus assembly protein PilC